MGYILDTSPPPQHTILRGRVYYFQLRVSKQHQQAYGPLVRARLSECGKEAEILASHLSQLLKQAWSSNTKVVVCIDQALQSARPAKTTFAAVAEEYIAARQVDHKSSMVAVRALLTVAVDREVQSYKRDDTRALLAYIQSSGNKTATVKQNCHCKKAVQYDQCHLQLCLSGIGD